MGGHFYKKLTKMNLFLHHDVVNIQKMITQNSIYQHDVLISPRHVVGLNSINLGFLVSIKTFLTFSASLVSSPCCSLHENSSTISLVLRFLPTRYGFYAILLLIIESQVFISLNLLHLNKV